MLPPSYRIALRAPTSRQLFRSRIAPAVSRVTSTRFASQDYGSGSGDPVGESPQKQGGNPASDAEHPGPPPPDVGQKDAGSTTHASAGSQGHDHSDQPHSRATKNGAQPKFNTEPEIKDQDEVRKHNEEVDSRKTQSQKQGGGHEGDQVGKGFWSGQGGVDKDP